MMRLNSSMLRLGFATFALLCLLLALNPALASAALDAPPSAARAADIPEKRTAYSQSWPEAGGGVVTRISPEPIYWRDQKRKLRPYDVDLKRSAVGLAVENGPARITLPSAVSPDITIERGRHWIRLDMRGAAGAVAPIASGREATYREVFPGVTRRLTAFPGGLKEDLIIASSQAQRRFEYTIRTSAGLHAKLDDDGNVLVNAGQQTIFSIPRGVAYEQSRPAEEAEIDDYKLRTDGDSTWRLTVGLDEAWANNPARSWPVVLDPSYVDVEQGTIAAAGECQIEAGYNNRASESANCTPGPTLMAFQRSFGGTIRVREAALRFVLPAGTGSAGSVVTKATLAVHPTSVISPNPAVATPVRATRLTQRVVTPGGLRNGHAIVADDVQNAVAGVPVNLDVTAAVRGWHEGRFPNYGLALTTVPGQLDGVINYTSLSNLYQFELATTSNPDPGKRPTLTVHTATRAQAVSEVVTPTEGQLTGRFVELVAKAANPSVTSAVFEYRGAKSNDWEPIPTNALTVAETGATPGSEDIPINPTFRQNAPLVWDLDKTPGAAEDGAVSVRAILDSGPAPGGGYTSARNFRIDRKNGDTASELNAGPGSVNLLTGNFSVTETDAAVPAFLEDLRLTRTYHSRGGSPRTNEMFGPGWIAGFDTDGGDVPYKGIYNFTEVDEHQELAGWTISESDAFWGSFDASSISFDFNKLQLDFVFNTIHVETKYSVLEYNDGRRVSFREEDGEWVSDDKHLDLSLTGGGPAFTLKDAAGNVTTFEADASGAPQYSPTSFAQAGSSSDISYQYATVGGRKRLHRIVAPTPSGISCSGSTWTAGCRALELVWGTTPVGGKAEPRVTGVRLRAVDPSGVIAGDSHLLATYEYDAAGRLKKVSDPRTASGLPTSYEYDSSGRMVTYSPPGERPWTFQYQAVAGDDGIGRLRSLTRKSPAGDDATTTFVYGAPVSGPNAPRDMSRGTVDAWGQSDLPYTGTAVFPPDSSPPATGTPTSWSRATIHYLGIHGKAVNVADPEGNISTKEYDDFGNVFRELTAQNRKRSLSLGAGSRNRSLELDTRHTPHPNNVDLFRTVGPEHNIRRPDGSTVVGRQRTIRTYDVGKPTSGFDGDQHRLTELQVATRRSSDGEILDAQTTTHEYSIGADTRGWAVGKPLRTTVGAGSEQAVTLFRYHATLPLLVEKRMPKSSTSTDSYVRHYHYYGVGSQLRPSWCSGGAGLSSAAAAAGSLCAETVPGVPTSGAPRLSSAVRYSLLWQPVETREAATTGAFETSPLRSTSIQRDALGRETARTVTASTGVPVTSTASAYSAATGRPTTSSGGGATISRVWDDNGRLSAYTDADGGTTTYTYDLNGRLLVTQDPRGTRGLAYDDRDLVTSVVDSGLSGPITTSRDADGQVTEQVFPGGFKSVRTYEVTGAPKSVDWQRAGSCSGSACRIASSAVERDGHGRIATHQSDHALREYSYDSIGRLSREDETREDVCKRRQYGFDKNSNRLSRVTQVSAPFATCGSGPDATKVSTYDGADRLTGTGYSYDALGRTLTVPASDSPSGNATFTYAADDLVASISTSNYVQSVTRDPLRRLRSDTTTLSAGSASTTSVVRYSSDEDAPTAKTGSWGWERYVEDASGTQSAIVNDSGGVTWQLTDIRGDVVATLDGQTSSLEGESEYDAFGEIAFSAGAQSADRAPGLGHGWLGGHGKHTAVARGGFVHMGARVYNPVTGRFLQVDPIESGAANAYDYANQDPVNRQDLNGLKSIWSTHWSVPQARSIANGMKLLAMGMKNASVPPIPGIPGAIATIIKEIGPIGLVTLATEIEHEAHHAETQNSYRTTSQNRRKMHGVFFRVRMRLDGPRIDVKLADPMRKLVYK